MGQQQTGIDIFDHTIQKTNLWIKELMRELHTDDKHFAYVSLRSVLHALRDRVPKEEAIHLAAQLPLLISGIFFDGWHLREKPYKWNRQEFFERIREGFRFNANRFDPVRISRAVFGLLERHLTPGQIEDIVFVLPKELRNLWPSVQREGEAFEGQEFGTREQGEVRENRRQGRQSEKRRQVNQGRNRLHKRRGLSERERRERGEAGQRNRLRMAA